MALLKNKHGFTLIELLLVTSLALMVSAATLSSLVQGTKIFRRFEKIESQHNIGLFIEKFTRDLKRSTTYSLIPFSGTRDSITFASLMLTREGNAELFDASPVSVNYRHDPGRNAIIRHVTYPANFGRPNAVEQSSIVAEGVNTLSFEFLSLGGSMPSKIGVSISLRGDEGMQHIRRDIVIPHYRGQA